MKPKKKPGKNKKTNNGSGGRSVGIDRHNHDIDINRIIAEVNGIASHARETLRRCAKRHIGGDEEVKLRIQVGVEDLNTIKHVLKPLEDLIQL